MNRAIASLAIGLAALPLAACATPENIIEPSTHHNDPLVRFTHCNGYGCSSMYGMKFSPEEWAPAIKSCTV